MATTKITNPELFDLGSLNTALQLPSGTTAERPTSPSTGEWRYNTTTNLIEYYDGGAWRDLQSEDIPPVPSENFNTVLWTGNGSGQSITGVGYAPDFVWLKNRDQNNYAHRIFDTSRGVLNVIKPSSQNAQSTDAGSLTSFDSDGFTLGNDNYVNNSGDDFVGWTMKVNGGTTVSNTDGSVTSTVQLNSKTKFSIVEFQGAIAENSVGHGLGVKPEVVIVKELGFSANWNVYYDVVDGSLDFANLNNDNAGGNSSRTMWTSSVFYWSGNTTTDCVAYCFSSVAQFSKFGSYTGTGSATNKPIINTGFEPAFVMIKSVSTGGTAPYNWNMYDNKRNTSNPRDKILEANKNDSEITASTTYVDFLTNGFQIGPATSGRINGSGVTYLYFAFASDPSTAPVLADSFGLSLYTGTSATHAITGLGFTPSLVWIKDRGNAEQHVLNDSSRGATRDLSSNTTAAETTRATGFLSFDSDGFTLGTDGGGLVNDSARGPYVAWAWKANTIPTINTDGTIQSMVSANQASGFSVITWAGTGAVNTVGHGLNSAPELILIKSLSSVGDWQVYSSVTGNGNKLVLNSTSTQSSTTRWDSTSPTSSVFTLNDSGLGTNLVAYAFHSVSGFSKIGSYTGTGAAGNTVTIGFEPSWIMIKRSDSSGGWLIFDSKRNTSNPRNNRLEANSTQAEQTGSATKFVDFDATSFEPQISDSEINASGGTYVYMAFKENPGQPAIPSGEMEYLVQAGGASGASNGGGGGAGGLRTTYGSSSGGGSAAETNITLSAGTYTITVGGGGASIDNSTSYQSIGNSGTATTISGNATVNTVGGGGGGSNNNPPATGGCGGGSGSGSGGPTGAAGTAGEGFAGGNGMSATHPYTGGGGGGTAAVGATASGSAPGAGGAGLLVAITGSNAGYGGGGGGTGGTGVGYTGPGGAGGFGGGGAGGAYNGSGTAGTANTGGGGGATGDAGSFTSGAGGSGVVILRMNTSDYSGSTTGSPTVTTVGSETILTYTGSGTYVHS